ncbi:GxGYxYP domain-containing protein [Actinocatenispora sera]|uniref:GxGYxYP domain-containing protein n=1 Tax=Actinocatenispora sera TaxID=390989 RepID=UPI0033F36AC8
MFTDSARSLRPTRRQLLIGAGTAAGAAALGAGTGSVPAAAAPGRTGIDWPRGQVLPHFAAPAVLDLVDLTDASDADQLLVASLQGLVNRTRPRIATLRPADEGGLTWLHTAGLRYRTIGSPAELLRRYRSVVHGVVVTDPDLPATRNVATTLAGLHDAVIVSPDQLDSLSDLPVIADLRGRFADEIAAYTWAVDTLWPHTEHRILVGLDPENTLCDLRDYAVATRALTLWIHPDVPESRAIGDRVMSGMAPGTAFLGWWPAGVGGESDGTELTSRHGVIVLAADHSQNLTVYGGASAPVSAGQRSLPAPPLANRVYVTFSMTEGDNLQYNQHKMRQLWDDPGRGTVPLNWSTNPLLIDAAPVFLSHYQRTATRNDYLIAGPSGAGYAYPSPWPDNTLGAFTGMTARYMRRTGMDAAVILNRIDGDDVPLSGAEAARYLRDVRPLGLFKDWTTRTELSVLHRDTPQAVSYLTSSVAEAQAAIAASAAGWSGDAPLFLSIGILSWNLNPTDVGTIAASLADPYTVVRGDQFFHLARRALQLPGH